MDKLLREFTEKNVKVITAPLHLSNGGIAQYQGQCYCIISSFNSLRKKRFTASYLLGKILELGDSNEVVMSVLLDSFGSPPCLKEG